MPVTLVDNVKIYSKSTGTGAISLGSAVPGYRGVEALTNGKVYSYSIQQVANYEYGRGTYISAGQQLIRSPIGSSNGGTPLNLQPNAEVALVALAEDISDIAAGAGASAGVVAAQAWAQSPTSPDPNDPTAKSAKSWVSYLLDNGSFIAVAGDMQLGAASKIGAIGADLALGTAGKLSIIATDMALGAGASYILRAPQAAQDAVNAAATVAGTVTSLAGIFYYRYVVGRPIAATLAGATASGASTYILNDPIATTTVVQRLRIKGGTAGGAVRAVKGTIVGGNWTRTGFVDVGTLGAGADGLFTVNMSVTAGEYLGVSVGANTFAYNSALAADGSGWRLVAQNAAGPVAVGALNVLGQLQFGFDDYPVAANATDYLALSAQVQGLAPGVASNTTALARATTSYLGPSPATMAPAASGNAQIGTWVVDQYAIGGEVVSQIRIRCAAAQPVIIRRFIKTGNQFDQVGVDIPFNAAAGVNTLNAPGDFAAFKQSPNETIGFYSSTANVNYRNIANGSVSCRFATGGGNVTSFVQASLSAVTLQISVRQSKAVPVAVASALDVLRRGAAKLPFPINFVNGYGQSNEQGASGGSVSNAQEYDNQVFPAQALNPTQFLPMTLANTQNGTGGEAPIIGMLSYMKDRLLNENELAYGDLDFRLIGCDNGWSGYSIAQLSKGQTPYTNLLSQFTAMAAIAADAGLSWGFLGTGYMQGEQDASLATAYITYRDALLQLESDIRTDAKAASGQHIDPRFVLMQLASRGRTNVALAQREAYRQRKTMVCAGPAYPYAYLGDGLHMDATSLKRMGALRGKALKREMVDGQRWLPLDLDSFFVMGNTAYFFMNRTGLKIDTAGIVPDQSAGTTNKFGFSAIDGAAVAQNVTSVSVTDSGNCVKVVYGANPAGGWKLRYGQGSVGYSFSIQADSGAGNLRDSAGDIESYLGVPMHNWSLLWDATL